MNLKGLLLNRGYFHRIPRFRCPTCTWCLGPRSHSGQTLAQHGPKTTHVSNQPLDDESPAVTEVVVQELPLVAVFGIEHADLTESTLSDPAPSLVGLPKKNGQWGRLPRQRKPTLDRARSVPSTASPDPWRLHAWSRY